MIKSLIWNIRGIAQSSSIRRLKKLIKLHHLKLLCVLEPFIGGDRIISTKVKLGMESAFASASGKIWLFWSQPFSVQVLHDMGQVIHCKVAHSSFPEPVFISYVYAKCSAPLRMALWDALVNFSGEIDGAWMVGGDFNVVQQHSEVIGGHPQLQSAIDEFNVTLLDCGLEDAGFEGSPYTWANGFTRRRLDRVVVNNIWGARFPIFKVSHLNRTGSDHSPLLMMCDTGQSRGPSRFKFLHAWLKHSELLEIVKQNWSLPTFASGLIAFQQKLIRLKNCLKVWNKEVFGNVFNKVQEAEQEVFHKEMVYDSSGLDQDRAALQLAKAQLLHALSREESFLRQQSRVRWLKEGDSNSKFFHAMIRKKRHVLSVHRIQESDGLWVTDTIGIASSAVSYFQSLLSGDESHSMLRDFDFVPSLVTAEDNNMLCCVPSLEEVREAVFSIDSDSSPGPDGFCSKFYQSCWDIIGVDLHAAVVDYFRGSPMPRGFLSTLLVLLPKKPSPTTWADFRPISLCNVSNKVITKILVTRLSHLLPKIISPSQSGFVKGRLIHDNILLAQEMVHDLNRKTRGGNVVLKLDMAKAYDRMSWPFILQMLRAFGFSEQWISLIHRAITSPWFSVVVNGVARGFFQSQRGLRQGDPISPSFFIIAAEYLSRSLNNMVARYPSMAYSTTSSITISHLSFADDTIIFANGSRDSLRHVMDTLHKYESVSGQIVSQAKSRFFVGRYSSGARRSIIHTVTGFQRGDLPFTYLGCPIYLGNLKIAFFEELVQKIRDKISGWANRLLSFGGKIVLIRHVLASMPIYLFHALRPPSDVFHQLERLFTKFLWGDTDTKRKIHWCKWATVCFPVEEGGIGVRSFDDVASACEIKLWWRFRAQNSLWATFMKEKYCHTVHPSLIPFAYPASPLWRRLCLARDVAEPLIRWLVKSGNSSFWHDCWVGSCALSLYNPQAASSATVASFWLDTGWDKERILALLPASIADQIFMVPIKQQGLDLIRWSLSLDGDFSFHSAWNHARTSMPVRPIFSFIWQKHIPLQVSFFIWRLVHSFLALDDSLESRGFHMVSRCICGCAMETHCHLFLHCPLVRQVWKHFLRMFGLHHYGFISIPAMLLHWYRYSPSKSHIRVVLVFYIFWHIWKARNAHRFDGSSFNHLRIIHNIIGDLHLLGTAFGFKVSQLRGDLSVRFVSTLRRLPPKAKMVKFVSWLRPPVGSLKLNVDGCSRGNPGFSAAGGIIRDHSGRVAGAYGRFLDHKPILYAELMALLIGLEVALYLGFTALIVESDSATAISWATSTVSCSWEYTYLLARIRQLCSHPSVQLRHVYREANQAADFLANWACTNQMDHQFHAQSDLPRAMFGILALDAAETPHVRT